MEIDEVTAKWDEAARSSLVQGYIHPSGNVGESQYEKSGQESASAVIDVARAYLAAKLPDIRVADFGCGDGRVIKYVEREFDDVWGIDASPAMLERMARRTNDVQPLLSNGVDGGLSGLEADLIYSWAVFIHHDFESGRAMLVGLASALAPGGFLALQIPCYDVARERGAWIDVTVWTPDHLKGGAARAGLEIVELWKSDGQFSYENIGKHHYRLQVMRKP